MQRFCDARARRGRSGYTGLRLRQKQTAGAQGTGDQWLDPADGYCWRYRRSFLLALTGALLATAFIAIIPLIQRVIMDNVIVKH